MKKILIDVSKVDWELLNRQKTWLMCFEPDDRDSVEDEDEIEDADKAQGIINLLDHIQDSAVEAGLSEATVFGVNLSRDVRGRVITCEDCGGQDQHWGDCVHA